MKKLISLLLALTVLLSMMTTAFAASSEATAAADALHELGLFNGTGTDARGNPQYDLDRAPTRAEAVTMLVRLLGKADEAAAGTWTMPFTDVQDWAKPYVGYAYVNGLTSGTGATTFSGRDTITASQYLTLVLRALGYTSGADFRWDKAWELSDRIGLTDGSYNAATNKSFLRGDVAAISYCALGTAKKETGKILVSQLADDGTVDGTTAARQGFDLYGLTEEVRFLYDIRTFTLFAFMNYTGYDDNNNNTMHPVRQAVRDELDAMKLQISSPNYYKARNMNDHSYVSALAYMGDAPKFAYISTVDVPSALLDLPAKLEEFYLAANIPELYEKYRPEHEAELKKHSDLNYLTNMIAYFGIDEITVKQFGIEIPLLMSLGRGMPINLNEKYYDNGVIRTGLSAYGSLHTNSVIHEYSHSFVNPIIDKMGNEISATAMYYNGVAASQQGYTTWESVVDECFVRAFAAYYDPNEPNVDGRAQWEYEQGFILVPYICDRIPEFEAFDGDFEAFMRMLLTEYPQYAN